MTPTAIWFAALILALIIEAIEHGRNVLGWVAVLILIGLLWPWLPL